MSVIYLFFLFLTRSQSTSLIGAVEPLYWETSCTSFPCLLLGGRDERIKS